MNPRLRLWRRRSSTTQLTLLYLGLLLASVAGFFGFFFWSTSEFLERQADATIDTEVAGLRERFLSNGLPGLTVLITNRVGRSTAGRSLYLLADASYQPMAGNLPAWPEGIDRDTTAGGRWHEFHVALGDGGTHLARVRTFSLRQDFKLLAGDDFFLLVGSDIQELADVRTQMLWTFGWTLGGTVILGAIGAWWISRRFASRIEEINRASRDVMAGKLSTRIPGAGASNDVNELVEHWNAMLDQIESLMASVRQVSDNIAHDLRTPLARLRNELESARSAAGEKGPETERKHLERSIEEADGLLNTFSALLRIARIEAGERRSGFAPVNLSALLLDVIEFYEPLAEARGQEIKRHVVGDSWTLGDRDLLFQAIANLVDNAVKYSPEGGAIIVSLSSGSTSPGSAVRISVSDAGPGIAPENRSRVIERFFRVEASRTTPGNGLGLALVAAVAKLHQGEVVFDDANPGLRVSMDLKTTAPPP